MSADWVVEGTVQYVVHLKRVRFIELPPERPTDEELDHLCWHQGYAGQRKGGQAMSRSHTRRRTRKAKTERFRISDATCWRDLFRKQANMGAKP